MKIHKFKVGTYVKHKSGYGYCNPRRGYDFLVVGYDDYGWVIVSNVEKGHDGQGCGSTYDEYKNVIDVEFKGNQYYFIEQGWLEEVTVHDVLEPTPEQKKETLKEMTKINVVLLTNSNTIRVDQNF